MNRIQHDIRIIGARENNLKDVTLTIPKHQITEMSYLKEHHNNY
jgi:excinuclease UvrABC ATPase subunit